MKNIYQNPLTSITKIRHMLGHHYIVSLAQTFIGIMVVFYILWVIFISLQLRWPVAVF